MWKDLVVESLRQPREAARRVLAANLPVRQLVEAALLVTSAAMVLGYLSLRMIPAEADLVSTAVLNNPLVGAVIQLVATAVVVVLSVRIGRLFGGQGTLPGGLALIVWLNAMLVLFQALQVVALALVPPLAAVLAILAMIWALWAYASFVAELHGFGNIFMVLGGVVVTSILLYLGIEMLAAILGLTPQELG
jgi:Yip1 domain